MSDKLTPTQQERLLAAIDAKLGNAYGGDSNEDISRARTKWIEAYLGLNTNPAPEGRSQVVDRSVYETISTMQPSLVRIFAGSSDEVCKFVPIGPEDEAAAELTTAYVNHVVTQKNPWEQICSDWIHDSLLLANGYAMAYWEENDKPSEEEEYEGQSDEQLALLMQDPEIEILEVESEQDEDYTPQMVQGPMGPMVMPPPMLHDIKLRRKAGYGCVKLAVLPPEHCIVDGDTPDWTLNGCDFFEYREQKTIAALRDMGLDVPDDISDDIDPKDTNEDTARDRLGESQTIGDEGKGPDRKVTVRMIWVRAAVDEKETKLYYSIIVGRTPLHTEPVSRIPVASMCPIPLPHRHPGMAVAETVIDQQEIKTAIKRGGLDNLYLANNGRHVISDKVNLEDFLDSRPGGVIRMVDGSLPAQGHVMPLVHPFQFGQIVEAMEYFDQERQNRSGVSRYFSGTDAGAINKTASGISQLTNAAAQRVEHIARMMAPAVEYLFSIAHELILKHRNKADMVKLRGQWVPIDPRAWQTKRDCRISVGVGAGNKDSLLAALNMQFQQQVMMAQSPLGLVKPDNLYQTLLEMGKLNGFANPQKFWTDPTTNPPQPQGPPPQLQVEMAKLQHDAQKTQAQIASEERKAEMDAQMKWAIANLQAQTQELVAKLKMDMEAANMQLQQQMAVVQAQNERLGVAMDAISTLHQMKQSAEEAKMAASDSGKNSQALADQLQQHMQALHERMAGSEMTRIERIRDPNGRLIGARKHMADGTVKEVPIQ